MKHALQLVGWLSVLAGIGLGLWLPPAFDLPVFFLYLLSGVLAGMIPLGLAEALGRLETIQSQLAARQPAVRSHAPTPAGKPGL